uniref:Uncharacterized protein n=1 Tax=Arundo donax TaxID=35708 RepID=A0A0A9DTD8_ARUDO
MNQSTKTLNSNFISKISIEKVLYYSTLSTLNNMHLPISIEQLPI